MIADVERFLRENPGTKAKDIAKHLGVAKGEVNSLLYKSPDTFAKDADHRWSVVKTVLTIVLKKEAWVDSASFEDVLAVVGSPLDSACTGAVFVVPKGCKIMICWMTTG